MDDINQWLRQTKSRAIILSDAYRIRLRSLWWANLMFVVLPAIFSTSAAIFAALPNPDNFAIFSLPAASVLAGSAAVLITVHKALKCDEYQAECMQLSHAYQSVSIAADSALSGPNEDRAAQFDLIRNELDRLSKNARVQISTSYMPSTL